MRRATRVRALLVLLAVAALAACDDAPPSGPGLCTLWRADTLAASDTLTVVYRDGRGCR